MKKIRMNWNVRLALGVAAAALAFGQEPAAQPAAQTSAQPAAPAFRTAEQQYKNIKVMNNEKSLKSVAETYLQMQAAPASVVKPSWVPSTIAEEHVNEFVKAVIEARVNKKTVVEFNEKKYLIKEVDPETQAKELAKAVEKPVAGDAKAIQAVTDKPEPAPMQNKPEEVKEEDEAEKQAAMVQLGASHEITRFKGLGEISAGEFKDFIGENIRLEPVSLNHLHSSDELLAFFMGKNTPERQDFIIDNLKVEKDLVEA